MQTLHLLHDPLGLPVDGVDLLHDPVDLPVDGVDLLHEPLDLVDDVHAVGIVNI